MLSRLGRSRLAPIHDAICAFDVNALRRELAAGVSPELWLENDTVECNPLYLAVTFAAEYSGGDLHLAKRIMCVAALLEAGAAVNKISYGHETALHAAVSEEAFGDIVDLLIAAGADVNALDLDGYSVLAAAAQDGNAAIVKKLISAGARDIDQALVGAVSSGRLRCCPPLVRAGAALPAEDKTDEILRYCGPYDDQGLMIRRTRTYIAKIAATPGGFKAYERGHRRRLTAVFANKFSALPVEVISHIVLLWAHCGDYDYWRAASEQIERECEAAAADADSDFISDETLLSELDRLVALDDQDV